MSRYIRPSQSIRMIIDYNRCIRVLPGDEQYMRRSTPYTCTDCSRQGDYNGKLVFTGDEIPYCKDHRRNYRPVHRILVGPQHQAKRGTIEMAAEKAA